MFNCRLCPAAVDVLCCYLGREFESCWDVAVTGCRAVLRWPVVLVPDAAATDHCRNHGNMGQEEEEAEEEQHSEKDPQLSVCFSLREETKKLKTEETLNIPERICCVCGWFD